MIKLLLRFCFFVFCVFIFSSTNARGDDLLDDHADSVPALYGCCWWEDLHTDKDCCEVRTFEGGICPDCRLESECCRGTGPWVIYPPIAPLATNVVSKDCCETLQYVSPNVEGGYEYFPPNDNATDPDYRGQCCVIGHPRSWGNNKSEKYNNHFEKCCAPRGGVMHGGECCVDGEPYNMEKLMYEPDNAMTQACCEEAAGFWTAFKTGSGEDAICCKKGTGKTWDGDIVEECCVSLFGYNDFVWKNGTCCTHTLEPLEGGSAEDCCNGTPYLQSFSVDTQSLTPSGQPIRRESYECCETGKTVYNIDSGLQDCCDGSVYTDSSNKQDCCDDGEVYTNGSDTQDCCVDGTVYNIDSELQGCCKSTEELYDYDDETQMCCPATSYVIKSDDESIARCCESSTDKLYTRDFTGQLLGQTHTKEITTCCPSKQFIDEICCAASSAKDVDGILKESCCTNSGGKWVSSSSSSPDNSDSADGTCCKGSMDMGSNTRTKDCCENAGGQWKDTFCCATWGTKEGDSCKSSDTPD